jgi:phosphotransferase family enzyme
LTALCWGRTISDMMATTRPVQVEEIAKTDAYRLIVFNRAGTSVLLESDSSRYDLPLIDVPKFTRPAKAITTLLRDRWSIPSVLLFSGMLEDNSSPAYFATLEAQVRISVSPAGMEWFPFHHAISHLFQNKKCTVLESSYLKATNWMSATDAEPFSRIGWLSNLQNWVKTVIDPRGIELKGFQQLNGSETFSLIRFDTTHRPVWFKAVGKPNLHEFPITVALAKLFPQHVPSILALHPTYQGWLMMDAGGSLLDELVESSAWMSAVTALATLQIQSISKTSDLLHAGCKDLSITNLLGLVDPFLDVIADLMKQQSKVPPPILTQEELSDLSAILKDALHCLADVRIPDTLGHSDFNPGNIIIGPERCIFLDWAEAHVGHPFLTFEYFLAHLRKGYPQLAPFERELRASYTRTWNSVATPEQIAEACRFSSLVAVFAYGASSDVWRDPERLKVPSFQGYLRSLTRRMKKEADSIQRRRVECLN